MNDEGQPKPGRLLTGRRILLFAVAPGAAVFLIGLSSYAIWRAGVLAEYEAECERIAAGGDPLTIDELVADRIAPAEDAAPIYRRAFAAMREATVDEDMTIGSWFLRRSEFGQAEDPAVVVERYLGDNRKALELAREAVGRPRCRFVDDWSAGLETELDHLGDIKGLASLLRIEALFHWRAGHVARALDSLEALFACAEAIDGEPCLISSLVGMAIRSIGAATVLDLLADGRPFPADEVEPWIAYLGRHQDRQPFVDSLIGERVLFLDAIERLYFSDESLGAGGIVFLGRMVLLDKRDATTYLRLMARIIERARTPYGRPVPEGEDLELDEVPVYYVATRLLTPAIESVLDRVLELETQLEAARVALRLSEARRRTGRWPASLDEVDLTGLVAVDRTDDRPMVYEVGRWQATLRLARPLADEFDRDESTWPLGSVRVLVGVPAQATSALAFDGPGERLAVGSPQGSLVVRDVATGRALWQRSVGEGAVDRVSWSPDGRRLAASLRDTFVVVDARTGAAGPEIAGRPGSAIAFHPDGAHLAAAGEDGLELVDGSGRTVRRMAGHGFAGADVVFSADGRRLVAATSSVVVWDVETGDRLAEWDLERWVTALALDPTEADRIAVGENDGAVRLLEVGRPPRLLGPAQAETICGVAFSPDGRRLYSASFDGTIAVREVATGRRLETLERGEGHLRSLAITPDGRFVVPGRYDDVLELLPVE